MSTTKLDALVAECASSPSPKEAFTKAHADLVARASMFGVQLADPRSITSQHERTWSAWALDRLISGDVKEAKAMLKKGLKK